MSYTLPYLGCNIRSMSGNCSRIFLRAGFLLGRPNWKSERGSEMLSRALSSRFCVNLCHQKHSRTASNIYSRIVQSHQLYSTCSAGALISQIPRTTTSYTVVDAGDLNNLVLCRRCSSAGSLSKPVVSLGLWTRAKHALGIKPKPRYPKHVLRVSGYKLFMCCADLVDYEEFFEVLDMADTTFSWFLIMELHVWLCMVRLAQEGSEGEYMRNMLVEAMWKDVEERARLLGGVAVSARNEAVEELAAHFRASLFAYDEGLLSDDRVLAGAVWRVFFQKEDVDPGHLALMVEYIRKQVQLLDTCDVQLMLSRGIVTFQPLRGGSTNTARRKGLSQQNSTKSWT